MNILLACCLVGDHGNALVHCALQYRLKRFWRHWYNSQCIHALRNHIFNQRGLLLRVCLCRANLERVDIVVLGILIHAFFHAVEPLNACNFNDGCN